MKNLSLAVKEDLLRSVRIFALERNTSVSALVREYLRSLVDEDARQREALDRLRSMMKSGIFDVGRGSWSREDLHD